MSDVLLTIENVTGGYGEADILFDLNMKVHDGEVVVIVGPNGAGKSTAMKSVFGLLKIRGGTITYDGHDITHDTSDAIVRRGICYVPQTNNVFPTLTVHENLEMGAFVRKDDISDSLDRIYEFFPPLKEKRKLPAGTLSGGQRQMVAMGKALMLDPKLLLLDEPTAGLSPKYMDQIFSIVKQINELGIGILMVEQNAKQALGLADRGYVLASGKNRYEDTGANLLANREVAEMFLGG
ncbi:ABC transporter ATP-binding protein [Aestuariispira insulae]|uniref:Amino acid/amide ABC transporter ATP-binding protein 2 (HAAT family) n=1 Tax=Aestuariispira insulae TaxID=1461337 RepID=A0A3D9HQ62_9PROT|nr:ABC transporter ATP-binding protein [Aestuariispira insulae]RED51056.1 amino acid/amide ABC transporter ATP-binding protein 2 (HAAT family) [Aestuariispira insulae]